MRPDPHLVGGGQERDRPEADPLSPGRCPQFIAKTCEQLEGKIPKGTHGISLIKGVDVKNGEIHIFSEVISEKLSIECAALSGANIANEVAQDSFSETTIGCRDIDVAKKWKALFETEKFRVAVSEDVVGVSLGGALKNVVAVAAGLIDGMKWGNNAKVRRRSLSSHGPPDSSLTPARPARPQAAVMRIGLLEMKRFALEFFPGTQPDTFVQESAGIADLITSCLGGRNHKVAAAFVTKGKVRRLSLSLEYGVRAELIVRRRARSRSRTSRRRCSTARSCRVRLEPRLLRSSLFESGSLILRRVRVRRRPDGQGAVPVPQEPRPRGGVPALHLCRASRSLPL